MSELAIWITIIGLTGVTLLTRAGFLLLPQRYALPPRLQRALRYAPACALIAIVVPDLMTSHGALALSFSNIRLLAALIAVPVFLVTRNMLATIAAGMLALTVLRLSM